MSPYIAHPSPNYSERPPGAPIDMLVIHYTGMPDRDSALARLCDPIAQVSAHYLIDEQGQVFHLVAEQHRAWHAGISQWRDHSDVNSRSLGIELVNPGHEFGYRPFPSAQMQALAGLARDLQSRWPIPHRNVVGHSDVAPLRKQDPGELFDWRWLAEQGVGLWPQPGATTGDVMSLLRAVGYQIDDRTELDAAIIAFQRHFCPSRCDGQIDSAFLAQLNGVVSQL
jgi:N-acetylmuramoyl-L-alanine amidase